MRAVVLVKHSPLLYGGETSPCLTVPQCHHVLHSILQHHRPLSISARANASAIGCGIKWGIKNLRKGGNAITPPIKWARHALSVVSSPVITDTEDTAGDQASIKTVESPAVIKVESDDEEPIDLEKELGMSSSYAFLTVSLI